VHSLPDPNSGLSRFAEAHACRAASKGSRPEPHSRDVRLAVVSANVAIQKLSIGSIDFWVSNFLTEKSDNDNFHRQSQNKNAPEARLDPVSSQSRTAP
tara:strand:- start:2 stop:295 length:294 start_codon:yes stop_codon:yes gene_type:complete